MKTANRERKGEIGYNVVLNDEQKEAKALIRNNQITVITGRAGSGKSLVAAQAALDFLFKKETDRIFVTRQTIEVGLPLGYLPGPADEKMNPYLKAFMENLYKCYDKLRIDEKIREEKIVGSAVQFIRGTTMDDVMVVEEAQNFTKGEMLAILTRLGKTGRMIINGDNAQTDRIIQDGTNGLKYAIWLSQKLEGIAHIDLKANHRSDLVGKILDLESVHKPD
jgi:predicted ribonuclease YlaK